MRGDSLTERQSEMLEVIRTQIKRRGMAPTRAELGKRLKIANQAGVDRMLHALVRKGWIRLISGVDRGIQLLRQGAPIFDAEDLPEVAASDPNVTGFYPEPQRLHDYESFIELFESRPDYYVRVKDLSLELAGYYPGDVVAVRKGGELRFGDVVVARVGNKFAFKRFSDRTDSLFDLEPVGMYDPDEEVIRVYGPENVEICGVVVGAIINPRTMGDD